MLPCIQPVFIQLSCNSASINIPDVSRLICMWHGVHLGHVMHCHAHFYQGDQSHAWQKVEVQIEMARIYNIAITHYIFYIFNNMYTNIYICVCVCCGLVMSGISFRGSEVAELLRENWTCCEDTLFHLFHLFRKDFKPSTDASSSGSSGNPGHRSAQN